MATTSWTKDLDVRRSFLGRSLQEHPGRFNFFQLVRLMERLNPDRSPVGSWAPPSREIVRFSTNSSFAFPPSPVQELAWRDGEQPLSVERWQYVYRSLQMSREIDKERSDADT